MTNTALISLFVAILSPFVWGLMNLLDKIILSNRVKKSLSYAIVAGIVNLSFGIILYLFLDWHNLSIKDYIFPAISGLFLGSGFFAYYYVLKRENVSEVIGLTYAYPIVIAFLSFTFLHERLSLVSYTGVGIILIGVLILTVNSLSKNIIRNLLPILLLIFLTAFYEFSVKVSTINMPLVNGIAITMIFTGLATLPAFFKKKIREGFTTEINNFKWAVIIESLTFLGVLTSYFAMTGLPATVVSSIAASQPLAVLILESLAVMAGVNISHQAKFRDKILPILLIVLGVVLLALAN